MKLKKLIVVLLFVAAAVLVVGCSKDGPADTTADTVQNVTYLDVIKDGACIDVVYSDDADSEWLEATNKLTNSLSRMMGNVGVYPKIAEEYDENKVEILIGHVEYPEAESVYETLKYGDVRVSVVGNKIVIAGYDSSAISTGITDLVSELGKAKDAQGNVKLPNDYCFKKTCNEALSQVPKTSGTPTFTDTGDGAYNLSFAKKTATEVAEYLTVLENEKYEKYAENIIEDNRYYTYTNKDYVINVLYTDYYKNMKVIIQSLKSTALPGLPEENVYDASVSTSFTQLGVYYDPNKETNEAKGAMKNANGMCYVMRLADGSFVIIDGGHADSALAGQVYQFLTKQAPDPNNIVIAAWVFTHAHTDHVLLFETFAKNYGNKVTVEKFIYNFPSKAQWSSGDSQANVKTGINTAFRDVPIVKAHPGQVFYLRNAKLTILYTYDINETKKISDYNNTSLVFTIEAEGKKILMTGDYSENGTTLMRVYTSETLKSDILQVPHHGVYGMANSFYSLVTPDYALVPVAILTEDKGEYKAGYYLNAESGGVVAVNITGRAENAYIFQTMDQSKVFVALDDVVVMTLDKTDGISVQKYEDVSAYLAS